MHNALIRLGVEVVTEEDHFVHVSGHPSRDELTRMYQMVRPRVAIPVHGEARHLLGHAELARQCQVPQALVIENGDMVRLDRGMVAVHAQERTSGSTPGIRVHNAGVATSVTPHEEVGCLRSRSHLAPASDGRTRSPA